MSKTNKIEGSEENKSSEENVTTKYKIPKKKLIIILAVIVLVVIGLLLYKSSFVSDIKKTVTKNQIENNDSVKVVGKSNGQLPYASTDKKNTVSSNFDKSGGVLSTTLANNIKAYLVIPEEELIQGSTATLAPYTEMPSGEKHGPISNELGYGLQVTIQSSQMGTGGYLVFDTRTEQEKKDASKDKLFNRCDPGLKWFDPYICGRINGVKGTKTVDKDFTVITPIHKESVKDIIIPKTTIPTGVKGLIAIKIEKGDVYIPQKVDKDLVEKLIEKNMVRNASGDDILEAAALALEWNIKELKIGQLESIVNSLGGEELSSRIKALQVVKEFSKKLKERNIKVVSSSSGGQQDDDVNDLLEDYEEEIKNETTKVLDDIESDTITFAGTGSIQAAGASGAATEIGLDGASTTSSRVDSNISNGTSSDKPNNAADAAEGSRSKNGDESFDLGTEEAKEKVKEAIEEILNNPNATIQELLRAAQLAQLVGLEDAEEIMKEVLDRIKKMLEKMLEDQSLSARELLEIYRLATMLGFDEIANSAMGRAGAFNNETGQFETCEKVKKDLKNYGDNECK